jgi:hypothetical protein
MEPLTVRSDRESLGDRLLRGPLLGLGFAVWRMADWRIR